MDREEFFATVRSLKLTSFNQVRAYLERVDATAKRMKSYILKGTACYQTKIREALHYQKSGTEAQEGGQTLEDILTEKARKAKTVCRCGYYEFFEDVFRLSGCKDFKMFLAKTIIDGRGDRFSYSVRSNFV